MQVALNSYYCDMKFIKLKTAFLLTILLLPMTAKANLIWPSIYIVSQYYTWYVILIGLIVELFAAKFFLKASWKKSALIVVSINLISAIVGVILIPISGIIGELLMYPFGTETFHISHWILAYIFAVISNTCVEDLVLRILFKYSFKRNFWWLLGANTISVLVSALVPFLNL